MDDPDNLLARGDALQHLGADCPPPHLFYEFLDDPEIDVGLKEHQSHFAQSFLDIIFSHYPLAAELFKDQIKLIGKILEH
jgi:hypothetical protein